MEISTIIAIPEGGETKIGEDCVVTRRRVSAPDLGTSPASFIETAMSTTSVMASSIMRNENLGLMILSVDKRGNAFMFKFKTPPGKEERKSIEETVSSLCPILLSVAADMDRYGIEDSQAQLTRIASAMNGPHGKAGKLIMFVGGCRTHRFAVKQMWCGNCKQSHPVGEHRMFASEDGSFDNPASMLDAMFPKIAS